MSNETHASLAGRISGEPINLIAHSKWTLFTISTFARNAPSLWHACGNKTCPWLVE